MMSQKNMTYGLTGSSNISTNGTQNPGKIIDISRSIPLIIIGIIILTENALVFLAFATNPKLRKKQSNILVCSQAVIDFLVGSMLIPWIEAETHSQSDLHSIYPICYILFLSLGNLLCLAVDRYLALIKPLQHHLLMSVSRTKRILLVTWVTPLFLTMIQILWHTAEKQTKLLANIIYLGILWSVMLLMCTIMIFMYIKVYQTAANQIRIRQQRIRSHHNYADSQITTTRRELRVAHLFGLLLFFFILAYLPILYLNFLNMMQFAGAIDDPRDFIPTSLYEAPLYSLAINSVVNPVLCLLLKKDYQLIIKRWICLEWVFDKRNEESQRSHTYCRTGLSDLDSNGTASEARGRIFGLGKSKILRQSSPSKPENKVRFSCKDDTVALMPQTQLSGKFTGAEFEINKNEIHSSQEQSEEVYKGDNVAL